MEKCGKIWKNGRFSGRLRPDWGDTALAATAGLGYIGLNMVNTDSRPTTKKCPYSPIVEESAVESANSTADSAANSLRIGLWVRAFMNGVAIYSRWQEW